MRTVGGIVGPRRDELDRIGPKNREIANVLLPDGQGPAVEGVRFRPVAELMAAHGIMRRRPDLETCRHLDVALVHVQSAQQMADAAV